MPSTCLISAGCSDLNKRYYSPNAWQNSGGLIQSRVKCPWPVSGTFSNLRAYINPAQAADRDAFLAVNEVASALRATIPVGGLTGSDLVHSVAVAAGADCHLEGTFVAGSSLWATMDFTRAAIGDFSVITAALEGLAAPATSYYQLFFSSNLAVPLVESEVYSVAPCDCVISSLYLGQHNGAFAAPMEASVTLRVNGVSTALTASVVGVANANDTVHSVAVAKGDLVNWRVVTNAATAASPLIGLGALVTFPTLVGKKSIWMMPAADQPLDTVNPSYSAPQDRSNTNAWGAVDTASLRADADTTVKGLSVRLDGAPGAAGSGKRYTFTLLKDGAPTALSCIVAETATAGEDAINEVAFAVGERASVRCTPLNNPNAVSAIHSAIVCGPNPAPTVTALDPNQGERDTP